jgi:hypothetical protein
MGEVRRFLQGLVEQVRHREVPGSYAVTGTGRSNPWCPQFCLGKLRVGLAFDVSVPFLLRRGLPLSPVDALVRGAHKLSCVTCVHSSSIPIPRGFGCLRRVLPIKALFDWVSQGLDWGGEVALKRRGSLHPATN